jgi:hypothetical protein
LLHVRQNTSNPMPGETLNPPAPVRSGAPKARMLPTCLLYSIFARIGGSGLDTDAFETLRASYREGFLGKAIAYDNRQREIPASRIRSLRWHPVRLISFLDRPYYYGAKKKYLDWIASREVATGRYDLFHSWSGDCLRSLKAATAAKRKSGDRNLPHQRLTLRVFRGGKTDCCSSAGVSYKSTTLLIFCWCYRKRQPTPFASADSRRKNSFTCLEGWMSNVSDRGSGHRNFALFLQER